MPAALVAIVQALLPGVIEGVKSLWTQYGQTLITRWDGMRDQKLRDEKATLEATSKVQRNVLEGKAALEASRQKTPERLSKGWWSKGAVVLLTTLALGACSMLARPPLPVAPVRVTLARPAFADLTEAQQAWLSALVLATEENCTALAIIGGMSPAKAVSDCAIK